MKHIITIHYGDYIVTGNYLPSTPDVFYLRNGDPGYPGDPSEFEPFMYRDKKGRFIKDPFYTDDPDICTDIAFAEMCELADAKFYEEEEKHILDVVDGAEDLEYDGNGIINMMADREFSPGFDPNADN